MKFRLLFLLALFLPELSLDPLHADLPASLMHPIGTDALGRDGLLRLAHASARSLGFASCVGLVALVFALCLAMGPSGFQGARSALRAVPPLLFLLPLAAVSGGFGWTGMGLLLAFLFAIQLEAPLRAKLDPFRRGPAWAMNRVIGAGFLHILKTWSPWAFRQAAPLFPLLWLDVLWSESAVRLLGLGPGPQYDSLGLLLNEELPRLSSDPTLLGFAGFAALLGLAWSTSMESRTPIENPIS